MDKLVCLGCGAECFDGAWTGGDNPECAHSEREVYREQYGVDQFGHEDQDDADDD